MLDAIRDHWPEYLIEAWCLATFMISACLFAVALFAPSAFAQTPARARPPEQFKYLSAKDLQALTDKLEEDRANCQWNERDEVMPDDFLKNLPGSHAAPELARALTLNVHAADVRRLKKRNLQQAARPIVAFMREHPDLLVGVNLDPDVYINPFFSEAQWYDYNPGTLRQFREWLAGAGPYAGAVDSGVPDLSCFRREPSLSLHDVCGIARQTFATWDDVDAPRVFPRSGDSRRSVVHCVSVASRWSS